MPRETPTGELYTEGQSVFVASVTPTITAGVYNATTANAVGGILTLANAYRDPAGDILLQSIVVTDKANQKAAGQILFFNALPAGGTYTDHGQINLSAGDLGKLIGAIVLAAGDWITVDNSGTDYAVATKLNLGLALQADPAAVDRNLYVLFVNTGAPTYASTTDLTFKFGILQD
jgi:hypothetical protein